MDFYHVNTHTHTQRNGEYDVCVCSSVHAYIQCICVYPLEESMATHTIFLPGESHGQRSLVGYIVYGVGKSQM